MRCEVVAVGSELLLGQIVDTNSAWIGEQLALAGIDSLFQVKVGDNLARIVAAIRQALARADAVICCGGLGPTQDDITREAIAEVANVDLVADPALESIIRDLFEARGRTMAANNLRQALVPQGATIIPQTRGTAPGLICPVGDRVVYAVPGVPHEMREMVVRGVIPDLNERAGERATIVSRTLRTWGLAESTLAERVAPRLDALEATGNPTIAFLASGIEGIKVRVTAKATAPSSGASGAVASGASGAVTPGASGAVTPGASAAVSSGAAVAATAMLDAEEEQLRALLGDIVFGTDDDTMESAVGALLVAAGLTVGLAESLTGGLVAARCSAVPGASTWLRGGVVSYATDVKRAVLGVADGPVVSEAAAREMAEGAVRVLGADVGLALTGVAGPDTQEDQPVGTVWVGLHLDGRSEARRLWLPGDRDRVRQMSVISALDLLRRRLLERASA